VQIVLLVISPLRTATVYGDSWAVFLPSRTERSHHTNLNAGITLENNIEVPLLRQAYERQLSYLLSFFHDAKQRRPHLILKKDTA
jgi:hypothetical protein